MTSRRERKFLNPVVNYHLPKSGQIYYLTYFIMNSVIAVCFSGNVNSAKEEKLGGEILITVTADDKHTVHVWRWMIPDDK